MTAEHHDRPRVLIVDDEPGICRALDRYLTSRGFEPVVASTGPEAIERAGSTSPRVALVDLRLPGMDGREVIRRLQQLDVGITSILMTAYGGFDTAVEATLDGAYAYLPKPLDLDEIGRLVDDITGRPELAVVAEGDGTPRAEPWILRGRSGPARALRSAARSARTAGRPVVLVGEVGSGRARLADWLIGAESGERCDPVLVHGATSANLAAGLDHLRDPVGRPVVALDVDDLDDESAAALLAAAPAVAEGATPRLVATARPPGSDRPWNPGWVEIPVPSLPDRLEDVEDLVAAALREIDDELDLGVVGVDGRAMRALRTFARQANLRELDHALRFAAIAARGGVIRAPSLPRPLRPRRASEVPEIPPASGRRDP